MEKSVSAPRGKKLWEVERYLIVPQTGPNYCTKIHLVRIPVEQKNYSYTVFPSLQLLKLLIPM